MECYVLFAMKENFLKDPMWFTRVGRAIGLASGGNMERIKAGKHTLIIQFIFAPNHSADTLLRSLNSAEHPLEAEFVLMEYGHFPRSNLSDWKWMQQMKNRASL